MSLKALCFVDMPFGKKTDPASGVEIDFDAIYEQAIKPAISDADLDALRGDEERTGGIVHAPMFARLLLSEYVVADLTLANANVFYELGIRHAAKPFTTVPIFANVHPLPFDVSLVRSIPYSLDHGKLSPESAAQLRAAIHQRLENSDPRPGGQRQPALSIDTRLSRCRLAARGHRSVSRAGQARRRVQEDPRCRPREGERCGAEGGAARRAGQLGEYQDGAAGGPG